MAYVDFDFFVLPFILGVIILVIILFSKFFYWWDKLLPEDRIILRTGLRAGKTMKILLEVFLESLIHRKMFKQNPWMGYMHMTFAFGWFSLLLIGNLESRIYSGIEFNMPYYPIFFKFFMQDKSIIPFSKEFTFLMDFFLLFILSGLLLALYKRLNARMFGMKRPTHPSAVDRLALTALWFIFPLRLLAESFTSALTQTGGFLTAGLGNFFAGFLPVEYLAYPAWWGYSIALGVFFVLLPYSRYMHIPAEVLLIYMRNLGFMPSKKYDGFSVVEVNSCPSCGVCIEHCQLNTSLSHKQIVPAYFLKRVKREQAADQAVEECLLCGRCQEVCPVGIHVNDVRMQRRVTHYNDIQSDYSFVKPGPVKKADVVYFAGCMTHLTPGIKKSMEKIMAVAGVNYFFIDKDGGTCCGRPLQMAGQWESARQLIESNKKMINQTQARVFVTSCPICLKVFREEYHLKMEVLHHSQYIHRLMEGVKIQTVPSALEVAFHDPCELGRGCGIYLEPRLVIQKLAGLQTVKREEADSLCCGGSLGSFSLSAEQRRLLSNDTLNILLANNPDYLVTACPLCKKTFQPGSIVPVLDLAELVAARLKTRSEQEAALQLEESAYLNL